MAAGDASSPQRTAPAGSRQSRRAMRAFIAAVGQASAALAGPATLDGGIAEPAARDRDVPDRPCRDQCVPAPNPTGSPPVLVVRCGDGHGNRSSLHGQDRMSARRFPKAAARASVLPKARVPIRHRPTHRSGGATSPRSPSTGHDTTSATCPDRPVRRVVDPRKLALCPVYICGSRSAGLSGQRTASHTTRYRTPI